MIVRLLAYAIIFILAFGGYYLVAHPSQKRRRELKRVEHLKALNLSILAVGGKKLDTLPPGPFATKKQRKRWIDNHYSRDHYGEKAEYKHQQKIEALANEYDLPNPTMEKFDAAVRAELRRQELEEKRKEAEHKAVLAEIERSMGITPETSANLVSLIETSPNTNPGDIYDAMRHFQEKKYNDSHETYDHIDGDGNVINTFCTGCDKYDSSFNNLVREVAKTGPKMVLCACGNVYCTSADGCDKHHGHCSYGCSGCPHPRTEMPYKPSPTGPEISPGVPAHTCDSDDCDPCYNNCDPSRHYRYPL